MLPGTTPRRTKAKRKNLVRGQLNAAMHLTPNFKRAHLREARGPNQHLHPRQNPDTETNSTTLPTSTQSEVLVDGVSLPVTLPLPTLSLPITVELSASISVPDLPSVPPVPPFPSTLVVPSVPPFPSPISVSLPAVPSIPLPSSILVPTSTTSTIPTSGSSSTENRPLAGNTSPIFKTPESPEASSINNDVASAATPLPTDDSSLISATPRASSDRSAPTASQHLIPGAPGPGGGGSQSPSDGSNNNSSSGQATEGPTTPQIVGGVVGGIAGLAVLLILALLLLRLLKRRQNRAELMGETEQDADPFRDPRPEITPTAGFLPPIAASVLKRLSGAPKDETKISSPVQERGFQRISGRKLPSAFSAGLTSDEIAEIAKTPTSDRGFRRSAPSPPPHDPFQKETLMPSPARTPVIHSGATYSNYIGNPNPFRDSTSRLGPPSGSIGPRGSLGSLGRSHPSFDGSRGSRFTEDV